STTASTVDDLQIGKPGVTELDTPANVPSGAFMVTAGPLTPNTTYYFRAFATNGTLDPPNPFLTGYSDALLTFKTSSGSAQGNRSLRPEDTVKYKDYVDYANLNQVLFFQPTTDVGWTVPEKQVTFTNNLATTVYPFMRDAAATIDPRAKAQGTYQG